MRRWNGWGDDSVVLETPQSGLAFLQSQLGSAAALSDASFAQVCEQVPPSRLAEHPLINTAAAERVKHARGQSFPDWLAMRSGDFGVFPDGVAYPQSSAEVRELLDWAALQDVDVIPYGGGTSVAGHINPELNGRAVLTIDMGHMNRLLDLNAESQIATFGAGAPGPQVEAQLRAKGYTLGHFPQSWELSTLGGWVASRSSGQQSFRYGRIEQIFAGGKMECPNGTLEIPTIPASAAGTDLREVVLGSEGRMGIITEVKVRVTPLPEQEKFIAVFMPDFESAKTAVRSIAQKKIPLSMLRVSNAPETQTQLKLAGHEIMIAWLEKYLALRGIADGKCLLTFGLTGNKQQNKLSCKQVMRVFKSLGGVKGPAMMGKKWAENRFRFPYLRENLWQAGYAVDTLETATDWENVSDLMQRMEGALHNALQDEGVKVHVFTHLSHVYTQGSSIYTSYVFPVAADYAQTLQRWKKLKHAASMEIAQGHATISHQHGVGVDHAPYMHAEKGPLGMAAIESLLAFFDPQQRMNPGKLIRKE